VEIVWENWSCTRVCFMSGVGIHVIAWLDVGLGLSLYIFRGMSFSCVVQRYELQLCGSSAAAAVLCSCCCLLCCVCLYFLSFDVPCCLVNWCIWWFRVLVPYVCGALWFCSICFLLYLCICLSLDTSCVHGLCFGD
jgi:hypothetical protein